uniref:Uncharacterized protein n=1 Tax=Schistosoma mansoni TaxID=6183 RepID=A0A5K4F731_SCHMA
MSRGFQFARTMLLGLVVKKLRVSMVTFLGAKIDERIGFSRVLARLFRKEVFSHALAYKLRRF